MENLDLTAKQCRLAANIIDEHMQANGIQPLGFKIIQELVSKCGDSLAESATVTIQTDAVSIDYFYPLINAATGEIDADRKDMKDSLMAQIGAGMASNNPTEWNTMAALVGGRQATLDNRATDRITSGKDFLQSLR